MTPEIAFVLGVLVVSLVLFISEVIRMDLVALLVLSALAIRGLIDSEQAFGRFEEFATKNFPRKRSVNEYDRVGFTSNG